MMLMANHTPLSDYEANKS